ncbi:MAG: hypothetical protein BWZ02_01701 [Lentisphaerae bacterium ADurb.BinA184]|nr:MAG: hypothetical protein BWZ02_01701 [Lentisphaerae bacterium ADurb.BinA184]
MITASSPAPNTAALTIPSLSQHRNARPQTARISCA